MELDELADTAVLSKHLNYSQGHVRGCDTRSQPSPQLKTDYLGKQHVDGLAQHHCLGLNPSDSPS